MDQPVTKKMKINNDEILKLQKEIIEEGINKRSYSSAEESESDDSDQEIIKMYTKKSNKGNFDYIGYSFTLTNKLSKMRSELARTEERMRYLQLDNSNTAIKLEELHIKNENSINEINEYKQYEISINKYMCIYTYIIYLSFAFNSYFIFINLF